MPCSLLSPKTLDKPHLPCSVLEMGRWMHFFKEEEVGQGLGCVKAQNLQRKSNSTPRRNLLQSTNFRHFLKVCVNFPVFMRKPRMVTILSSDACPPLAGICHAEGGQITISHFLGGHIFMAFVSPEVFLSPEGMCVWEGIVRAAVEYQISFPPPPLCGQHNCFGVFYLCGMFER